MPPVWLPCPFCGHPPVQGAEASSLSIHPTSLITLPAASSISAITCVACWQSVRGEEWDTSRASGTPVNRTWVSVELCPLNSSSRPAPMRQRRARMRLRSCETWSFCSWHWKPQQRTAGTQGDSLGCYSSRGQEGECRVKFTGGPEDIVENQGAEWEAWKCWSHTRTWILSFLMCTMGI